MSTNEQIDNASVRDTNQRWFDALGADDPIMLEVMLADDWTFYSAYGNAANTKADFVGNVRSGRFTHDFVRIEEPLIRLYGQTAIVTGRAEIQFRWEGEPHLERLYYTAVYGWAAPQWRMLALHTTHRAED